MGTIAVLSVYCPSLSDNKYDAWCDLINCADGVDHILLSWDFSAHSEMRGAFWKNSSRRELSMAVSDRDLVPLKDHEPNFLPSPGKSGLNLDLVFLSAYLAHLAWVEVSRDTYHSNNFLVNGCIDATVMMSSSIFRRFNINIWISFSSAKALRR